MLDILVLNPSSRIVKNVVRDVLYGCWCTGKRIGGGSVPPFALLSLATILARQHKVRFLDAQAEQVEWDQIVERAKGCDLVACTTSMMTIREDAELLSMLRAANPGLRTVVFGSHPTFMPQFCLTHDSVDVVVRFEPEFIIRDLALALEAGGEAWRQVPGIGYRQDGQIVLNEPYPFIDDLDQLPYPDVDLLPAGIHYFNPLVRRMPYMTAITSKGCPGKCTFCTAPGFEGPRIRFQSANYVLGQMEYLAGKGYREVYFRDETFFVHKSRDAAICRGIMERKLDLTWLANARVSHIDAATMEQAREAGCHTIKFGIESGSQEILDRVKKGYRLERALEVFSQARRIGINTHAHVMLGNPGETMETLKQTMDFVNRLRPSTATFGLCTPYPGTPLFEEVASAYPEIADGSATDLSKLHVEGLFNEHFTELNREQLRQAVRRAYRNFYLRPSYWLDTLLTQFRGIDDIKRVSLSAANVLDFALRGE